MSNGKKRQTKKDNPTFLQDFLLSKENTSIYVSITEIIWRIYDAIIDNP